MIKGKLKIVIVITVFISTSAICVADNGPCGPGTTFAWCATNSENMSDSAKREFQEYMKNNIARQFSKSEQGLVQEAARLPPPQPQYDWNRISEQGLVQEAAKLPPPQQFDLQRYHQAREAVWKQAWEEAKQRARQEMLNNPSQPYNPRLENRIYQKQIEIQRGVNKTYLNPKTFSNPYAD